MAVSTCMSVRLRAMTNISGACRLAATVCPGSTLRLMTMPSDRGANLGAAQVDPRLPELRLALLDEGDAVVRLCLDDARLRLRCFQRRLDLVQFGGRDEVLRDEGLLACVIALGIAQVDLRTIDLGLLHGHRRAGGLEVGLGLADAMLVGFRRDLRDQLAGLHGAVEVDEDLADLPGNL